MAKDPLIAVLKRELDAQARLAPTIAAETGLEVYAPLTYAWESYRAFVEAYRPRKGSLLFCGLNPGPYGVGQTGIPFTDVRTATARLDRIPFTRELPGYAPKELHDLLTLTWERSSLCVYNFLDHAYADLDDAYADVFVTACSWLLYVDRAKKPWNITPEDSRLRKRADLADAFARMMNGVVAELEPRGVVAIGRHAEKWIPAHTDLEVPVIAVRHPAREPPKEWGVAVARVLRGAGLLA